MRVIFIGAIRFSLQSLENLMGLNVYLAKVVTKESSPFNCDHTESFMLLKGVI
jgi:methionyl-tRNA formyltransferase